MSPVRTELAAHARSAGLESFRAFVLPENAKMMRVFRNSGFELSRTVEDGIYTEDFHHSCRVALTGVREAYFSDYRGTSREWLASCDYDLKPHLPFLCERNAAQPAV